MLIVAFGSVMMPTVEPAAQDFIDTNQAVIRAGLGQSPNIHASSVTSRSTTVPSASPTRSIGRKTPF
jgi:hypothetical protein